MKVTDQAIHASARRDLQTQLISNGFLKRNVAVPSFKSSAAMSVLSPVIKAILVCGDWFRIRLDNSMPSKPGIWISVRTISTGLFWKSLHPSHTCSIDLSGVEIDQFWQLNGTHDSRFKRRSTFKQCWFNWENETRQAMVLIKIKNYPV